MNLSKSKTEESESVTGIYYREDSQTKKENPLEPNFIPTQPENKKESPKSVNFFRLFRYATTKDIVINIIGIVTAVLTGCCTPLQMLTFGRLTNNLVLYQEFLYTWNNLTQDQQHQQINIDMYNHHTNDFQDEVRRFGIHYSGIGFAIIIGSYMSIVAFNYTAMRQALKIRSIFFKKTINQDIKWFDLNQTGDFTSRMAEDLSKLEEGIGEKVGMFLIYQTAFLGNIILAFVRGWQLALVCLISFPLMAIVMIAVGKVTAAYARKEMLEYGKAGVIAEEVLSAIRTVVAFGGQEKEEVRYSERLVFAKNNNIRRSLFNGFGFGLLYFFMYGSYALSFWYGIHLIIHNETGYDAGTLITVFFSIMVGTMNFNISSPFIESFSIACGAAVKVFSVIDMQPVIDAFDESGKRPFSVKGLIEFKNVKFEYPSRLNVPVLQGLNITVPPGKTVALVGTSGCGKSTCIQLLQRLYDPREGSVTLDGENLRELNVAWLRNQIGVVGQEPVLFSNTIAENIRYGKLDATEAEIHEAAKKANAHGFIMNLPKGYETLVGERGAQMSGGQKQRIAIARALIRNPSILLLDEATSALDTGSEAKVQRALDNASTGRTTIIVAHRLSTIRGADKIIVISKGQVVEEGTHEELMSRKGHYFNLVTTQVGDEIEEEDEDEDVYKPISPSGDSIGNPMETGAPKRDSYLQTVLSTFIDMDEEKSVSMFTIMKYNSKEWPQILIACLGSIVMGAAVPTFSILFSNIIQVLANNDPSYLQHESVKYAIFFLIFGVIVGGATFTQTLFFGIAGENLTMRLRALLFKAMLQQEIGWFDDPNHGTGTLCSQLSAEAAAVQGATGTRIGTVLQAITTIVLALCLAAYYEWELGLVALAFSPIILIVVYFERGISRQKNKTTNVGLERANKLAVEVVSNIRTVVSLNRETVFYDEYVKILAPSIKTSRLSLHLRGLVFGAGRSVMFFAYSACVAYGSKQIIKQDIDIGTLIKVSQALIMGTVSMGQAFAFAPNFQRGIQAAGKIINTLNRQPKVQNYPGIKDKSDWVCHGDVKYTDISFAYPTRPNIRVLRRLNLAIQQGKTIALVGQSGCGKSTIVQLLERFYDPDSGTVSLDNYNLKTELTMSTLRKQLGIVSQEPVLFDRSIQDNIAYGDNTRHVPMDEIIDAAKKANIHNFITTLPSGYQTTLGDKGTQLSGGQKQRVAIARALIRNPRILLLDEATSALDTESEQVVQDALDRAKEGRTCITIAHRLSTIQDADMICVLNRGIIHESGTHHELLALRGMYYGLHSLQGGRKNN